MDTPMLKRRLNPFLLASTVLILSLLAGLSVLYQGQLNDLVSQKQDLKSNLQQKNQRISTLQAKNQNLSSSLQKARSDLERYIDLYRTERDKRKQLQQEVSNLEGRVNTLESTLSTVRNTLNEMNESLEIACNDDFGNLSDTAVNECQEWGYR